VSCATWLLVCGELHTGLQAVSALHLRICKVMWHVCQGRTCFAAWQQSTALCTAQLPACAAALCGLLTLQVHSTSVCAGSRQTLKKVYGRQGSLLLVLSLDWSYQQRLLC
jgi:hypothetical protein